MTLTRSYGAIGVDPDAPLIRSLEVVNLGVGYKDVHSSNTWRVL